ncbi:mu-type opioid receptor-like [Ptychodera flava]|uniref:mu-type opioid receptor-like n=1 Tax=Ptychodera flava TaxID=63121 RepID=UPI00396A272A
MNRTNITEEVWNAPDTTVIDAIIAVTFTLIFLTGVPGNLLTIYVIARKGRVKTTTNVYILSLACADLVFVLCSPFYAVEYLSVDNKLGDIGCRLRDALDVYTMLASIFTLTIMSIDRFVAVVFPIKSLGYRSDDVAKCINVVIWIVSFTVALPKIIFNHEVTYHLGDGVYRLCRNKMSEEAERAHITTIFVLAFPIPFLIITFCYVSMVISLMTSKNDSPLTESDESKQSKRRVARMVLGIVIAFFICWLPFWIYQMIRKYSTLVITNSISVYIVQFVFIALTYVNSCLNPLLYTFLSGNFRKNVKKAFKCCNRKVAPTQTIATAFNSSSHGNQSHTGRTHQETGTF